MIHFVIVLQFNLQNVSQCSKHEDLSVIIPGY